MLERAANLSSTTTIFGDYELIFGLGSIIYGDYEAYVDSGRMHFYVLITVLAVIVAIGHIWRLSCPMVALSLTTS